MDDFGLIDIDAPLPEDAVHADVIDVAPSPSSSATEVQQHSSPPAPPAVDGLADLPPLEQPSDVEHSPPATSQSSLLYAIDGNPLDPPVLVAPTTRFLDTITPPKQPPTSDLAATSPAAQLNPVASTLADQLSAYKRRKTEQSSARSQLNSLVKRSGEDFIDLNPYSTMPAPQPPPVRPSSAASERSEAGEVSRELFAPWVVREYRHPNFTLRLHEELLDFAAFISPTASEEKHRAALLLRLSDLTSSLFPSSNLRPFGSYATKLYLPMGDLDCCLFNAPSTALHQLHRALEREGWASYLEHITSARIPIVKFLDRSTGLRVDICQDQSVGLEAAQYISQMSVKFPAFRPLLLFLKYFLHVRRLNDTYSGGVGSFLLQLMLLSHLHHHPAQTHDVNLGLLLVSFFDTYGNQLNYQNVGISLSPPSFYNKHDKQRFNPQRPLLLSVENPLDSSHDVGLNSFGVMKVRRAMQYAYGRLTERRVMEGRWEGSLLAVVLGVGDDEELRKRGDKKEREREKRARREEKEDEPDEDAEERRRERKRKKKEKRRKLEEEEEGEIVVDGEDEPEAEEERKESEHNGQTQSHSAESGHKHDEEREQKHPLEETTETSLADERDVEDGKHEELSSEEKGDAGAAQMSLNQPSPAATASASPSALPASSSTAAKWHPGQPFPEKWLRLFNRADVSAILEQLDLDDAARQAALKQFADEKQVWSKNQHDKRVARLQEAREKLDSEWADNQEGGNETEETQYSELIERLKRKGDKRVLEGNVAELQREAERRYISTWNPDNSVNSECLWLFRPGQVSAMLEKRTDIDDRTRRRLLLDFRRDKLLLLDRLRAEQRPWGANVIEPPPTPPVTLQTWMPRQLIPTEWVQQYSVKQVREALDARTDVGHKNKLRMLDQFKSEKSELRRQAREERDERAAEELKEQPGLYEVQEEWLLMSRAQVDKLLRERGVSEEVRTALLQAWREELLSKTNADERALKQALGQWTKQDEQEWAKWKRLQKLAKLELPKQDGLEVFNVPSEWLQWDSNRVKQLLKEWKIRGAVKQDVLRQWRERKDRKEAGVEEEGANGPGSSSSRRAEKKKTDERLKSELKKLMLYVQQEKALQYVQPQDGAEAATQNGSSEGKDTEMASSQKKKRQRAVEESGDDAQEQKAGSGSKRQKSKLEVSDEVTERWQAMPKQQRRVVQAEVLQRLGKHYRANLNKGVQYPQSAAEHALYEAEWKKAIEQRLTLEAESKTAPLDDAARQLQTLTEPKLNRRERDRAMSLCRVAALKRWEQRRAAQGRTLSAAETKDGNARLKKGVEKELNSRTAAEWLAALRAMGDEAETSASAQSSKSKSADPSQLTPHEMAKVRSQVTAAVLQRQQQAERAKGKQLLSASLDYTQFNAQVDAEIDSRTADEWRQALLHNGGAAELEEDAKRAEEKVVRKQVLGVLRQQRKEELEASGKKVPTELGKLFPVSPGDQKLYKEAVEAALERHYKKRADKQRQPATADEQASAVDRSSKHRFSSPAAAAVEPDVIDLLDDDDELGHGASSAAGVNGHVSDTSESWAEETSARPKMRADDEAQVADE